MRKHLYAASAILAAALVFVVAGGGSTPTRAQTDPASRAIQYLQSQQLSDGSVPGFSAFDGTEFYVVAAAAAGYDPNQLRNGSGQTAVAFLQTGAVAATSDAGNTGRLIQAVVAAGGNPHAFGSAGDLVVKLSGYLQPSGAFGDGQTATQALAIQGLIAAGSPPPAASLNYLNNAQDSDGGWDYLAIKDDPNNYDTSDTNSTAAAVMALDAAGYHSADALAIHWLTASAQQQADGGFGYQGGPSDPISTAVVIQMLVAAGQNPNGVGWTLTGKTAHGYLLAAQVASGGFAGYLGTPDAATTSQAVFGLLQQPLPARGAYTPGSGPTASIVSGLGALRFLEAQQSPTSGALPPGFSTFDSSEYYVIGAAAAGYDANQLATCGGPTVIQYLKANATAATGDAGNTGRLLLAAVAAGQNVNSFGGVDLVARLNGYFGTGPFYQTGSAQGQALAILGLKASGKSAYQAAVDALRNAQDFDGGWDYLLVKDDPNAASNYDTSDTNSTAFALLALAAAGDHSADASALAWLRTQQQADGGFGYQGAPSDPVSDALVLQALLATFQDPASTGHANGWAVGSNSPFTYLAAQQQVGGGFIGYGGPPDAGTTSQVVSALERRAYPVPAPSSPGVLRPTGCPSPSPSPSPTASPTPAVTPHPPPPPASSNPAQIAAPAVATPQATAEPLASPAAPPSPSPAATPAATPAPVQASPQPGPTVHPPPAPPGGGIPAPLLYALVGGATLAAVVVLGGAILYLRR